MKKHLPGNYADAIDMLEAYLMLDPDLTGPVVVSVDIVNKPHKVEACIHPNTRFKP